MSTIQCHTYGRFLGALPCYSVVGYVSVIPQAQSVQRNSTSVSLQTKFQSAKIVLQCKLIVLSFLFCPFSILGFTSENALTWKTPLSILMPKLSTACYALRMLKQTVSQDILTMIIMLIFIIHLQITGLSLVAILATAIRFLNCRKEL